MKKMWWRWKQKTLRNLIHHLITPIRVWGHL
jgi:hypothetical protein